MTTTPEDARRKLDEIATGLESLPAIINQLVSEFIEREFGDHLRRIEFAATGLAQPGSVEAQEPASGGGASSAPYLYNDGRVKVRLPPPPDPRDRASVPET